MKNLTRVKGIGVLNLLAITLTLFIILSISTVVLINFDGNSEGLSGNSDFINKYFIQHLRGH